MNKAHICYRIFQNTIFPNDIIAPTFTWQEGNKKVKKWNVSVYAPETELIKKREISVNSWRPSSGDWKLLKEKATGKKIRIEVQGIHNGIISEDKINFEISSDKVEAPIFYRAVPLPFKFARENLKRIRWHYGHINSENQPHTVLENIPVCANCHSFTADGSTLAMDVDARDDKGAYALTAFENQITLAEDSLIH